MNAMTLYYDPEVWHKKNLIFHFMNFNENLRNLSERERKKDLYLGIQKSYGAENDIKLCLGHYYTILYCNLWVICFKNIHKTF